MGDVRRLKFSMIEWSDQQKLAIESFFININELMKIAREFTPSSVKDYTCVDCGGDVEYKDHGNVWVGDQIVCRSELRCCCVKKGFSDIPCDIDDTIPHDMLRNLDLYRLMKTSPSWHKEAQ